MAGDANARSPILSTMKYQNLAITNADDLLFGTAPKPLLTRQGLRLGGGLVYPELNFTLPAMEVTAATMPAVARHYQGIIKDALRRAAELEAPGVVGPRECADPPRRHGGGAQPLRTSNGAANDAQRQPGVRPPACHALGRALRSEEHTSELQSPMY